MRRRGACCSGGSSHRNRESRTTNCRQNAGRPGPPFLFIIVSPHSSCSLMRYCRLGRGLRRHPWLLIEAGVFAMLVEVRLRVLAIQRVLSRFSAGDAQPPIPDSAPSPATVTRAIETVYRLLPLERTCLKHALIFCHIYRRRGLPAVLRIGVQQNEGFAAHAWVEDGSGALLTD